MYYNIAPNNGLHPTPRHAASHESLTGARVMPGVGRLKALAFLLNGGNDGENYRDRWGLFQEQK